MRRSSSDWILAGPFPDGQRLGVAQNPRHDIIRRIGIAADDLQRPAAARDGILGGREFREGRDEAQPQPVRLVRRLDVMDMGGVESMRRLEAERDRGLHIDHQLQDLVPHHRIARDRVAECLAD